MDGMAPEPKHARLTRSQRAWLTVAVTFAIAEMLAGFWFSFWNLRDAAAAQGWHSPWLLPLIIDLGIPTYVIVDHVIVSLGWHSRLARGAAWGFAGLTIALNGAVVTNASLLWRLTAAAMPAVWVLGIETLRLLWRVLRKDPETRPAAIPAGRWLAAPAPTFFMWRRMRLHNVTSYAVMAAREDARQRAQDRIRAAAEATPPRQAPGSLLRAVRSGRLPASVTEAIGDLGYGWVSSSEAAVDAWVDDGLLLPERVSESLEGRRQVMTQAAPEITPRPAARVVLQDIPRTSPSGPRKPSPSAVKRMSGADLAPYVGTLLETTPGLTASDVMKTLKVGRVKADEALKTAQRARLRVASAGTR